MLETFYDSDPMHFGLAQLTENMVNIILHVYFLHVYFLSGSIYCILQSMQAEGHHKGLL